jgi:hypothetical protein
VFVRLTDRREKTAMFYQIDRRLGLAAELQLPGAGRDESCAQRQTSSNNNMISLRPETIRELLKEIRGAGRVPLGMVSYHVVDCTLEMRQPS